MPIVKQWLREAAKTGIRFEMLTTEPNAKAFGWEGEATIKQNMMPIWPGAYAIRAHAEAAQLQRPAVLQPWGTPPQLIDVSGLPEVIGATLPLDVVWTPSASSSRPSDPSLSPPPPLQTAQNGLSEEEREKIIN